MGWASYHLRSLTFHWKSHVWVALAVAVATAVLTGALIVGDSMRQSLKDLAIGRLGKVDYSLVAPRLFGDDLDQRLGAESVQTNQTSALILRGSVTHAENRRRAGRANLFGVKQEFWNFDSAWHSPSVLEMTDRSVALSRTLADELDARVGADVLLHLGKHSAISTETLLGRRDETTATLRLTVAAVLEPQGLASFELNPRQTMPLNAFLPLTTLQRALDQPQKANALLIAKNSETSVEQSREALASAVELADLGLQVRMVYGTPVVESDALFIAPALEQAIQEAAKETGGGSSSFFAYLANTISKGGSEDDSRTIPYSTVVAVDPDSPWIEELRKENPTASTELTPGSIVLNQWAAEDLNARVGDKIVLAFYLTEAAGTLTTRSEEFTLRGIVPLAGQAADPDLVPPYKGVTDAKSLADWDPPFPVDLKLIRDKDEEYWKQHRTTPKAFISLADGQRLWAQDAERFGRVTSIRLHPNSWSEPEWSGLSKLIKGKLDLRDLGFEIQPIREQMVAASSGPTDFGMLFLSFSFFLIASAAMLIALLFRLGIEKRMFEIGLLLATGFAPRIITANLIVEGLFVSILGAAAGLLGAAGFAWLMLAGLTSWWSAAVNASALSVYVKPLTLAAGAIISLAVATGTIAWSMRGLVRRSPRSLLAGATLDDPINNKRFGGATQVFALVCALGLIASLLVGSKAEAVTRALLFFSSGVCALILCFIAFRVWLSTPSGGAITTPGAGALLRMGARSARRNRRRSLLTAGLIASAAFLLVSLEAFRLDANESEGNYTGSGGFGLYAESSAGLPYDIATHAGRENLGLPGALQSDVAGVASFRLRPGDESSCLNLYRPSRPRILGASDAFISRGGFVFAESIAEGAREKENPWMLLKGPLPDSAVPAIADANAVRWQYHLGLGKDLTIQDERGREVRLRFVGLLSNSVLQDEIIVADEQFTRLFPSISNRSFFLIQPASGKGVEVEQLLERELEQFGFDAATTKSRLQKYFAVQNTYITTFQTLGGLGLLLGVAGMAAVLVRNVWERRRELALMRTAGFTRAALACLILAENLALVMLGISAGVVSALLSIAPAVGSEGSGLPIGRLGFIFALVLAVGCVTGLVAAARAVRVPLIPALRNE